MIKKLGKSKRNIMKSIQKNNDLLCQSQLEWRFQESHKWSNEGKASGLHIKQAIQKPQGEVKPEGAMRRKKASTAVFRTLEDEWAIRSQDFDKLRDKWRSYKKKCVRLKKVPLGFSEWQQKHRQELPEEQRRFEINN